MGQLETRRAVREFLAVPPIPGLRNVYRGIPTYVAGEDWSPQVDTGWAAVAAVHVMEKRETRIALGGAHGGQKQVDYLVDLVIAFRWIPPGDGLTEDGVTDGWTDAFDQLLNDIETRIRSDRTFGGSLYQAGEGTDDIATRVDFPTVDDNGTVLIWAALEFHVTEILTT